MMILVILFLFCARFVNSQTKPNIYWNSPDQLVTGDDTVKLQCAVDYKGTSTLLWSKVNKDNNDTIPIASNDILLVSQDPQNPKLVASKEDGKFTLKINNVSIDDDGYYKCSVSLNSNYAVSKRIRVTVRTPPSILENTTSPITARVNTETKLECYVSGTPPPKVIWTREDNSILPTGSETYDGTVLRINRVKKEDAGTYYCTAKNEVGPGVRKIYKLQVEFEPEIQVARKRVGQALLHKAELECRIAAFPDPEISWTKNSSVVPSWKENIQITKSTQPNAVTVSKLIITTVNRSQYGTYACKAKNTLGEAQSETIEFYETSEAQCFPTCGSSFGYPDFKLIFSTTCLLVLIFRW